MSLDLEKIRAKRQLRGTYGTRGTANIYAGTGVPYSLLPDGTRGTAAAHPEDSVPSLLRGGTRDGTDIANVHGAVPTVPTVLTENSIELSPLQDHTFWFEDFGKWALSECLFSDRCFGGVKVLHWHFCDWCAAQGSVGCMFETFEALLSDEGFLLADGLVAGLILKGTLQPPISQLPRQSKRKPVRSSTACLMQVESLRRFMTLAVGQFVQVSRDTRKFTRLLTASFLRSALVELLSSAFRVGIASSGGLSIARRQMGRGGMFMGSFATSLEKRCRLSPQGMALATP